MIKFNPWRRLQVTYQPRAVSRYLRSVGVNSVSAFHKGIDSPKSGVWYAHPRHYRASSPDQFPAKPTGRLRRSVKHTVAGNSVTVGTSMYYSKWLRGGSKHMAPRKMSPEALAAGIRASSFSERWVRWKRAK